MSIHSVQPVRLHMKMMLFHGTSMKCQRDNALLSGSLIIYGKKQVKIKMQWKNALLCSSHSVEKYIILFLETVFNNMNVFFFCNTLISHTIKPSNI